MRSYTLPSGKILSTESREPLLPPTTTGTTPPTLILLHGLGSSSSFYYACLSIAQLQHYRIITYDFDGHGLSPVSTRAEGKGALSVQELAQDLEGVLDVMGVTGPVGIVAHSMSGVVACTFASLHPSRVSKLLLLGPVKALPSTGSKAMQDRAIVARVSGLDPIVSLVLASATSPYTRTHSPLSQALIRSLILGTSPEGYARACEALATAVNPDWTRISAETLIIGGATDYLCTKEVVAEFVQLISGARSVELENVGHWIAAENPGKVAEIMMKFF